ncbi:MAG: co-chaperone GroES [Oceanospirillaceae bacterium]|nr:co-chaperone GroES [Oceanospirillaceae bacterium]
MSIRPLHDRLVVRRLEAETTSKGGILLPGNAQEKPSQGEVIAVGDGVTLDNGELRPLAVRAGDRILFGKFSGSEVKLDGETLLIMRESDVLAVIENAGNEEKVA